MPCRVEGLHHSGDLEEEPDPLPSDEIACPGDLGQFDFDHWAEAGYPEITEGLEGEVGRQAVKDFFTAYLGKKWNKRKEEKLLRQALREILRLKREYPGLYEYVLKTEYGYEEE